VCNLVYKSRFKKNLDRMFEKETLQRLFGPKVEQAVGG